ncbi:MAG: CBS domain-containing protein [Acidobacteria bacterium]|nr:CBS domain-containing protein [Acidobacteriota bacterium]
MKKSGRAGTKRAASKRRAAPGRRTGAMLRARDLMTSEPVTVEEEVTIGELCDLLQARNINGAPVVDRHGQLVGVVTQEDIIYGTMGNPISAADAEPTRSPPEQTKRNRRRMMEMVRQRSVSEVPPPKPGGSDRPFWADAPRMADPMDQPVRTIMTSPAISAEEKTPVGDLCRIMWNLRIHRVPILKNGRVTGLVSSMDLCRAILEGTIRI